MFILLTGYLIIYNVFQISIHSDVRMYGLLKVIGTTKRQLKKIILIQALVLASIGIPIGLIVGKLIGIIFVPSLMSITFYKGIENQTTTNGWIFIVAGLFSLVTVLISTFKPGRIASDVSPIEAVNYVVNMKTKNKKLRKSHNGSKMHMMAKANIGRIKNRTVLVIMSCTLSVLLLYMLFTLSQSFDMDSYVSKFVQTDFLVADVDFF